MVNTQRGVCGVTPQSGSEVVFQMAPYSLYSALRLTRTHRALVQSCVLYRWLLWGFTIRPSDEPPANLICTCGLPAYTHLLPPPPLHSPLTALFDGDLVESLHTSNITARLTLPLSPSSPLSFSPPPPPLLCLSIPPPLLSSSAQLVAVTRAMARSVAPRRERRPDGGWESYQPPLRQHASG